MQKYMVANDISLPRTYFPIMGTGFVFWFVSQYSRNY
jgi:hypothetical protein